MLRRTLFAVLLVLSAWAADGLATPPAGTDLTAAASTASHLPESADDPDGSDSRWKAWPRPSASVDESACGSHGQHLELTGAWHREPSRAGRRGRAPTRPPQYHALHLRDFPLLI